MLFKNPKNIIQNLLFTDIDLVMDCAIETLLSLLKIQNDHRKPKEQAGMSISRNTLILEMGDFPQLQLDQTSRLSIPLTEQQSCRQLATGVFNYAT